MSSLPNNNYLRGKIYKITSTKGGLPYIGSCVISKERRFVKHKADFKRGLKLACHNHLSQADCRIELIEYYPCTSTFALRVREQYHMDQMMNCNWNRAVEKKKYQEFIVLSKWRRLFCDILSLSNNHRTLL